MAELDLDPEAMLQRFRDRAQAVRSRPFPPVGGEERTRFIEQAQIDFQDFAILGDATATMEDGVLVLRTDFRPTVPIEEWQGLAKDQSLALFYYRRRLEQSIADVERWFNYASTLWIIADPENRGPLPCRAE